MSKYLISFLSEATVVTDQELPVVAAEAHAVIEEAKAAGVYVSGGRIAEERRGRGGRRSRPSREFSSHANRPSGRFQGLRRDWSYRRPLMAILSAAG
jgi:hypothetical protein